MVVVVVGMMTSLITPGCDVRTDPSFAIHSVPRVSWDFLQSGPGIAH